MGPFSCCFGKDQPQKLTEGEVKGGGGSGGGGGNNNNHSSSVKSPPKSADKLLSSGEAWTPVGLEGEGGGSERRNASHLEEGEGGGAVRGGAAHLAPLEGTRKAIDFDRQGEGLSVPLFQL